MTVEVIEVIKVNVEVTIATGTIRIVIAEDIIKIEVIIVTTKIVEVDIIRIIVEDTETGTDEDTIIEISYMYFFECPE